jgi:pilus assembly protein CpaE
MRFAVLARDPALAGLLQSAFDETGLEAQIALKVDGTLDDGSGPFAKLRWAGVHFLVAEVGDDLAGAIETLRRVMDEAPGTTVALVGPPLPADALLSVIRAGAVEYLPVPVTPQELQDAVRRVVVRRSAWEDDVRREGRTFGVFGTKGGSGVTTTAVNLALDLVALTGEPTLLVDLDLLDGGLEGQLDLQPRYTLADLVGSFHRLDEGLLRSFVLTHPSGLDVLAAPRSALEGEKIEPEQVVQVLRVLSAHYAQVVLDVGNALGSVALAALAEADELVMVLTPHLDSLRNARRVGSALRLRSERPTADMHVVLNRFVPDPPIAIAEIERALGSPIGTLLPFDEAMMRRSACGGKPAVLAGPSRYAKALRVLTLSAASIVVPTNGRGRMRSFLGGLLKRNGTQPPTPARPRTSAGR